MFVRHDNVLKCEVKKEKEKKKNQKKKKKKKKKEVQFSSRYSSQMCDLKSIRSSRRSSQMCDLKSVRRFVTIELPLKCVI